MRKFDVENGILYHYREDEPNVVIPKRVTKIGNCAFSHYFGLTSITIPNSVTEIGDNAFCYCVYLMGITIPKSVTIIGDYAFRGCRSFKSINIPNGVRHIGGGAFDYCDHVSAVNIPKSVTSIGDSAFDDIKNVIPQHNPNGTLRAFKGFNKDWTCRGFQYEIGKSFHQEGTILCSKNGFHACPNPLNVFNYYYGELSDLRFAEVEISGNMNMLRDIVVASDIKIVRELMASELAEIYNNMKKEK